MPEKIAIIGIGQTPVQPTTPGLSYKELMYEAAVRAYQDAGVEASDVDSFLTASEDLAEGTSIFDEYVPDQIGGAQRPVYTVGGDAIQAIATAYTQILSGAASIVAVEAHSKASNVLTPGALHAFALDPVFVRPLGFSVHALAGLEASAFIAAASATREHCAHVSVKNRGNAVGAASAPYAASLTVDEVMAAPLAFSPLTELEISRPSDGAVIIVVASEDAARRSSGQPVWIRGVGWATAPGLTHGNAGADASYARQAAEMAYRVAGLKNPRKDIDFAEVDDTYSYKELQHLEALGLFDRGKAGAAVAAGATATDGDLPVNVSGGSLGVGQLFEASGAHKVAEVVAQLRSQAGSRQLKKAKTGLAQSWRGFPTGTGAVAVLSRD